MARILIVEDNRELQGSLEQALTRRGYEVETEPDGAKALSRFAHSPADLVISDIYMPGMDGIEFLIRLRETSPEARVLAISGGGHLEKERVLGAASMLGAVGVLEKPFTLGEVYEAVERALNPTLGAP